MKKCVIFNSFKDIGKDHKGYKPYFSSVTPINHTYSVKFMTFLMFGDFNIDFFNQLSFASFLLYIMSSLLLSQFVNEPTSSLCKWLPWLIVRPCFCIKPLISCQTIPALSNSDHLGLSGLSIAVSVGGLTSNEKIVTVLLPLHKAWTTYVIHCLYPQGHLACNGQNQCFSVSLTD